MKRMMQFSGALMMALAVTACAGDDARDANNTPATGTGGAVAGTSGTIEADREFIDEQLAIGTAEIELGRLAQQKGTHADVKEFGALMVSEHQAAADELRSIAAQVRTADTPARTGLTDDHAELREELAKLSGLDFDRKYIEEMIDDHEEGIRDLESKAEGAAHADVKAWSARTLPKMRAHLERAKAIKETLDRATND